MNQAKEFIKVWDRLRPQITIIDEPLVCATPPRYLLKCYFHYDKSIQHFENAGYFGTRIGKDIISKKEIYNSVRKIRNALFKAVQDGFMIVRSRKYAIVSGEEVENIETEEKRIIINLEKLNPFYPVEVVNNNVDDKIYFLERFLDKIKQEESGAFRF